MRSEEFPESKYIKIEQWEKDDAKPKDRTYDVYNKRSEDVLCCMFYHAPWRQFVVGFDNDIIFNKDCLETLIKALDLLNDEGEK